MAEIRVWGRWTVPFQQVDDIDAPVYVHGAPVVYLYNSGLIDAGGFFHVHENSGKLTDRTVAGWGRCA